LPVIRVNSLQSASSQIMLLTVLFQQIMHSVVQEEVRLNARWRTVEGAVTVIRASVVRAMTDSISAHLPSAKVRLVFFSHTRDTLHYTRVA